MLPGAMSNQVFGGILSVHPEWMLDLGRVSRPGALAHQAMLTRG